MTSGFRFNVRGTGGGGVLSKVFGSFFFLLFFGMGLVFFVLISRGFWQEARTWFWQRTPCEILSSSIVEDREGDRNRPYRFEVSYRYQLNGQEHLSRRLTMQNHPFNKYSEVTRLLQQFPAESKAVCFVHPSAPEEAVLKRGNLWALPFGLIPLVFMAVGAGGIYSTWRRRPTTAVAAPISERAKPTWSGLFFAAFFGAFLAMGSLFLWLLFIQPALYVWQARDWRATPCLVISSEVRTHSDSDGSTYSVEILYEYEADGRVYKSDRYKFVTGSSSGYGSKAKIVRQYPVGKQATCYVNPANPSEAVIERGFTTDMWFALLPLVFVAVGLSGIGFGVRTWLKKSGRRSSTSLQLPKVSGKAAQVVPMTSTVPEGARRLKPSVPPLGRLIISILVAAFWNGIVSVFVVQIVRGFERGRPEWFLTLFMIPFVFIGLGLIAWVFYNALALFNPRPSVLLTPGELRLGETFEVSWEFTGRMGALERVTLELEGREEATYRRGTSTSTDKSVFAKVTIADAATRHEMLRGHAKAIVPANTMHSFKAPNNKIVWHLRIHGRVPRWPDVKEEFPVTIHPAATKPGVLT